MADAPTPEENARKVLSIFVERFKLKAGKTLPTRSLQAAQEEFELDGEDLIAGIEFAVDAGWIEYVERASYRLTDMGFSEA